MSDSVITRIAKTLRFFYTQIVIWVLKLSKQNKESKTLLVVRLDSIGDYLLSQNLFGSFKRSKKFGNYKITLCGNNAWQNLAETLNKNDFDSFIWIDRDKFHNNILHKFKILNQIYKMGFETTIDTTFSREMLFGDAIVKISRAKERIGSVVIADSITKLKRNIFSDRFYTKLIPDSKQNIFEFYRNKDFLESILIEKILIDKPYLDCTQIQITLPTKKDFAVIFPGAQEQKRRWSTSNFEIVIEHLIQKYNLDVIIAGSGSDSEISKKMVKCHSLKSCFDMTGKTTLPQLAKLISLSKILISNETSAVHFAASVNTPFICISNGQRYGRFMPYPDDMKITGQYVYPAEIEDNKNDPDYLMKKYKYDSDLDINTISVNKVLELLAKIIQPGNSSSIN